MSSFQTSRRYNLEGSGHNTGMFKKKVTELKRNNENVLARMEHALARQGWHVEYIVVQNNHDN
jgi:hypothetical protein